MIGLNLSRQHRVHFVSLVTRHPYDVGDLYIQRKLIKCSYRCLGLQMTSRICSLLGLIKIVAEDIETKPDNRGGVPLAKIGSGVSHYPKTRLIGQVLQVLPRDARTP